ncbi:3193_t:CDS:2 [Ambispora leptoticha]|uniref:3193_t:CDS:1 n=1 Tax=Ambispora leptoticha TaxID=144679 RepID=A0A9N8VXX8_9GLOM|nr:3193_t:CDS:2 [Ambispora leptoticha]
MNFDIGTLNNMIRENLKAKYYPANWNKDKNEILEQQLEEQVKQLITSNSVNRPSSASTISEPKQTKENYNDETRGEPRLFNSSARWHLNYIQTPKTEKNKGDCANCHILSREIKDIRQELVELKARVRQLEISLEVNVDDFGRVIEKEREGQPEPEKQLNITERSMPTLRIL